MGDCLAILDMLPEESIDLVYIDPPFYSQKAYEIFLNNGAPRIAFEDRWRGGVNTFVEYLAQRINKLQRVLKFNGTFYIHLDWHIVHYMKVELDKIFGYHNFQNEIIWCYRGGGSSKKDFGKKHDTILRYSKTKKYCFYPDKVRIAYQAEGIKRTDDAMWGKHKGTNRIYKPHPLGKVPEDWWPINILNANDPERMGYPTQKPETLLERIIEASSKKDDLILDAFCGCGTTMAVAQQLKRKWIGIDISQTAIQLVENRLNKLGAEFETIGKAETLEELKIMPWHSFQIWAINAVFGRHSPKPVADMGIDGFTYIEHHPIQVKQIEAVGRPEIDKFVGVLNRQKTNKGMIIGLGFSRGAYDEVSRLKHEDKKHIDLIECEKLLKGEYGYDILVS